MKMRRNNNLLNYSITHILSYHVLKEILKFNKYYKDYKSFKNLVARILYNIFTTLSAIP